MRYQAGVASAPGGQIGPMLTAGARKRGRRLRVPIPPQPPPRIQIEDARPVVDGDRYRAKRCVGDLVEVSADVFRDGHEILRAVVRYRAPGERRWRASAMAPVDRALGGDRWAGAFEVDALGRWQ